MEMQQLVNGVIAKGYTQEQIAAILECNQSSVSRWASGERKRAEYRHYETLLKLLKKRRPK